MHDDQSGRLDLSHTPVTTALLVTNAICFIVQAIGERAFPNFYQQFALSVFGLGQGRLHQLITFQFLHANFIHLFGNLFTLFFFGREVERMFGGKRMLTLYFLSGCIGGLLQIGFAYAFPHRFGGAVLGASAGVFGLVAAFATYKPDEPVAMLLLFVIPINFRAKVLLVVATGLALFGMVADSPRIAHAAHLGGIFTGFCYGRWLQRKRVNR